MYQKRQKLLNDNVDLLLNGLQDHEKRIGCLVKENFFSTIGRCDWNGVELERYKKNKDKFVQSIRAALKS